MSIRWKLFLSLVTLTVGSSVLALWLAEQEFRNLIRERVNERFEAQVKGLLDARRERLDKVRDVCSELAAHESVRQRLKNKGSPPRDGEFLRSFEELRGKGDFDRLPAGRQNPPGRSRNPSRDVPLMGVVNLDGETLALGRALPDRANRRRRSPEQLRRLARQPSQEVAYVVVEKDRGGPSSRHVQEVVVTPVTDGSGTALGWFFMGVDAQTRDEQIFERAESLSGREARAGLVVEDEWFVPRLSESDRNTLAALRSEETWTDDQPDLVELNGEPFLLATASLNPDSPLGRGYQVTLFPIGSLLDAVHELRWKIAGLGLLATLAASLAALWLSARFNRPIAALVDGTERLRRGEFDQAVEVRSKDELGHLAEAFNLMTRDLELKERYHEVLGKVSDPAVARRLMEGKLELGGEVVEASVLFCDIRGFTALTDGMPPGEVIDFLNEHMTALTRTVYEHGGVVDKFVGDMVMALFGVPRSGGDDALRAARCAIAMLEERRALDERTGRHVGIGIGVAHGPLVAGCMGSSDRLNYTVLGDRVNLAARLCSAAGDGEVLVDSAVAGAAGSEFGVVGHEPVTLKGFARPVAVHSLRTSGTTPEASG
ncbi:adenylate/guanylate cyclase domain-containing protein [Haloferula sp. A504]|uniref:adenylate/guanylate cyclase domain-containing protein n=1 Tax=Haloferula sp. A504 TaxID=3373601 RepID=UPI0031CA72A9|nr:adenylate/guanylate cyclase domain-containing protein [Verrucomicrobiaceae bacterium E54]